MNDPHGYVRGFRRFAWIFAVTFTVTVTTIGIILITGGSAQ